MDARSSGRAFVSLTVSCVLIFVVGAVRAQSITIQTVPVGDPGNVADSTTGFGSVGYSYNIGEYDVTSSQYTAFLNAVASSDPYGCYNSAMAATIGAPGIVQSGSSGSYTYSVIDGRGNNPVTEVTFWDATRFANWLDNGQPTGAEGSGTTETGTYTLTSTGISNNTITRNTDAMWAVTSLNEWYKAAYYDQADSTYWRCTIQANSISNPSQANYNYGQAVGDTTPVGSYPYPSYYGTYDQGGDAWQWNESVYLGSSRGLRGGSYHDGFMYLQSNYYDYDAPADGFLNVGFRVVQLPEPTSIALLSVASLSLLSRPRKIG
jgi:formylglycine-generating enzyme